ncbi:MAG TPA: hypothetical protein PLJ35_14500 [Anaerolineae bacterium]|nr:hypothetical protein [Anaerolineae bacterium]
MNASTLPAHEQARQLVPIFATRNGERAAAIGALEPEQFDGSLQVVAKALKSGEDPDRVLSWMTPEDRLAITALDPEEPPDEAALPPEPDMEAAPALPHAARVTPEMAKGACGWLDRYITFSKRWSPRAYVGFHEACGLWLLSTVAARRVVLHFGGRRYTNLYIALAARTTLWAKSTTAKVAIATLTGAGLDWLLAGDATPQKFVAELTPQLPPDFDTLSAQEQARAKLRVALAGQRGWFYEEFGKKIRAMLQPAGFMAEFHGLLRQFDDCPDRFEYGTLTRGKDVVIQPYLALLANLTPADLRNAAKRNDVNWGDGFWARFAFVTPPTDDNDNRERFPEGEMVVPADILTPLRRWHDRLGMPSVTFVSEFDRRDQPARKVAHMDPLPVNACTVGPDVLQAVYAYDQGLRDTLKKGASVNEDLDGNYGRYAEKALRVAMLLASLENDGVIEMRHWAWAQLAAERWRADLHSLYNQVNAPASSDEAVLEDRLMERVEALCRTRPEGVTANEVKKFFRKLSATDTIRRLDALVHVGLLTREQNQKGTYRYHPK